MGHYRSEMYTDHRSEKEKEEDERKWNRKKEIEKQVLERLGIKRSELKILHSILKDSWNYSSELD